MYATSRLTKIDVSFTSNSLEIFHFIWLDAFVLLLKMKTQN